MNVWKFIGIFLVTPNVTLIVGYVVLGCGGDRLPLGPPTLMFSPPTRHGEARPS